ENDSHNEIHVRIGIHFGKVIIEEKDIYGDVVNVAAKLTNLANGDQIFVSHEVYELTKDMPLVYFELINFWNMKNVPTGLTIYKVVWEKASVFKPDTSSTLYLCPLETPGSNDPVSPYQQIWNSFAATKNHLLAKKHQSEHTLPDKTVILTYADSLTAFEVSERLFLYLNQEAKRLGCDTHPIVSMVLAKNADTKGELLPVRQIMKAPGELNTGGIYLTRQSYNDIIKRRDILVSPHPEERPELPFYKYVNGAQQQSSPQLQLILKRTSSEKNLDPCFYCGDMHHLSKDCPSKMFVEPMRAIHEVGYLSVAEINSMFLRQQESNAHVEQAGLASRQDKTRNEEELVAKSMYELKKVYQLPFLRTIWDSPESEWDRAKRNQSAGQGGFAWLAQDSLRVSDYKNTELLLKNALEKNARDYKPHCISGFLDIERNNFASAINDFDTALRLAPTTPQRIFIQLLQSRIYVLLNNSLKAQEKVHKILSTDPNCAEAFYLDILLKLQQKKEKSAIPRLSRLVKSDRAYFVIALIDPDMAPYSNFVLEELTRLLSQARADAEYSLADAITKINNTQTILTEKDGEYIKTTMARIDDLAKSGSYFGYLDMIELAYTVISICNNTLKEQKKDLSEFVTKLRRRLQRNLAIVLNHPFPYFSLNTLSRLKMLKSGMDDLGEVGTYTASWQFDTCLKQCTKISQEIDRMEPALRRLDVLQQGIAMFFRFLKYSSMCLSIVFCIGVFILPFFTGTINGLLSKLDMTSLPNASALQKVFLISGTGLSLVTSFLLMLKRASKEKSVR
ncbi:MAG TPA: adenylate/guanylate cyclase domain-containing protein, partial [Syntrophorhabdaceae bacterium]|nr:adenylate/guanylate cyclase domain-containing protein [Syntrophorhabdaceae bacterium]